MFARILTENFAAKISNFTGGGDVVALRKWLTLQMKVINNLQQTWKAYSRDGVFLCLKLWKKITDRKKHAQFAFQRAQMFNSTAHITSTLFASSLGNKKQGHVLYVWLASHLKIKSSNFVKDATVKSRASDNSDIVWYVSSLPWLCAVREKDLAFGRQYVSMISISFDMI